jgi:8-oxo-dGTP pyrophosphatase MutT (NUDIX family)
MHLVYINNKPLRFVNVYAAEEWKGKTESVFIFEKDFGVQKIIYELEEQWNDDGIIYMCANADVSWQLFLSHYTLSEAAGGLVQNDKGEYLLIYRRGKWDLPKGKLDYDETPEQAAVREVSEETGLELPEIILPLEITFHTYRESKKRILKKTHWYLMKAVGSQELFPQADEDITEALWMKKDEIRIKVYDNTYSLIKQLLKKNMK